MFDFFRSRKTKALESKNEKLEQEVEGLKEDIEELKYLMGSIVLNLEYARKDVVNMKKKMSRNEQILDGLAKYFCVSIIDGEEDSN